MISKVPQIVKRDFEEVFGCELALVLRWISENQDIELQHVFPADDIVQYVKDNNTPDEVFSREQIIEHVQDHFYDCIDDLFTDEQIKDYAADKFSPEEVFNDRVLIAWAKDQDVEYIFPAKELQAWAEENGYIHE